MKGCDTGYRMEQAEEILKRGSGRGVGSGLLCSFGMGSSSELYLQFFDIWMDRMDRMDGEDGDGLAWIREPIKWIDRSRSSRPVAYTDRISWIKDQCQTD
jgi:hypothetical protein